LDPSQDPLPRFSFFFQAPPALASSPVSPFGPFFTRVLPLVDFASGFFNPPSFSPFRALPFKLPPPNAVLTFFWPFLPGFQTPRLFHFSFGTLPSDFTPGYLPDFVVPPNVACPTEFLYDPPSRIHPALLHVPQPRPLCYFFQSFSDPSRFFP